MDDELSRKIDDLLNSSEGMEKILGMMKALGISEPPCSPPEETTPEPPKEPSQETASSDDNGMLSGLLSLAPLLGSLGKDDQNTALLKALRPYLHGGREKRLDESLKLMQLLKLLPLLQQKGGLFG